jgi:hypothetical protein
MRHKTFLPGASLKTVYLSFYARNKKGKDDNDFISCLDLLRHPLLGKTFFPATQKE